MMATIVESRRGRTQRINFYISELKKSQPEALENGLKTMYLRSMAQRLDRSVVENEITMQEIVDEVNAVRKERYEKQNRI
jgi:hypothetical protein